IDQHYLGTFSKDKIKNIQLVNQSKPSFLIINLQDSNAGSGTHWVCLYYRGKGQVLEYFDSYGVQPPQDVMKLAKKYSKELIYQSDKWQLDHESTCGWYCLAFVAKRLKGIDPGTFDIKTRDV